MGKKVIIAEKPSVAREFAKVLNVNGVNKNGYIEGEDTIVTWCVGHLVTMSYPEKYDEKLKEDITTTITNLSSITPNSICISFGLTMNSQLSIGE